MYKTGQLIWITNLQSFSHHPVKETRLCIVRRVYDEKHIDFRNLSTIYFDKKHNVPADTLAQAKEILEKLFSGKVNPDSQYVICEPKDDNVLNFSYTFGNMISKIVDLDTVKSNPLLDKNGNSLFVSNETEIKLSNKEVDAIAEGILYYFTVETTKKSISRKKQTN